jgi:hypothetical protein
MTDEMTKVLHMGGGVDGSVFEQIPSLIVRFTGGATRTCIATLGKAF